MTSPAPAPVPPAGVAGGEAAADPRGAASAVEHAMVTGPKTLPVTATVAEARAQLSDHVHMVLLVGPDGRLAATLCREDLDPGGAGGAGSARDPDAPAHELGRLEGRTVLVGTPLSTAHERLEALGVRRVAVVDDDLRLLGLLCLKRHRGGYCTDAGVRARGLTG